jgi:hypothetical protein
MPRYAQAAGAKSLGQIAGALNGRGIATARGGKWEAEGPSGRRTEDWTPPQRTPLPGCLDRGWGSQDPTGYEVGREFTLSDKSEFTETNNWGLTSGPHTRVSDVGPFAGARGLGAGPASESLVRRKPRGGRGAGWLGVSYGDLKVADGSAIWRRGRDAASVGVGSEHDALFRGRGCERRLWAQRLERVCGGREVSILIRVGDGKRAGRAPSKVSTMIIRPLQQGQRRPGEGPSVLRSSKSRSISAGARSGVASK